MSCDTLSSNEYFQIISLFNIRAIPEMIVIFYFLIFLGWFGGLEGTTYKFDAGWDRIKSTF